VRRAFFNLAAAERRREVARDAATLAARLLETARRRVATGDASGIDLDLAAVESARTAQAAALAQTERERAATRLAAALGITDGTALETAGAETAPPLEVGSADELVERALAARPDLVAADAERRRVQSEADLVHRAARVPNVTVRGFYRNEVGDERIAGAELSVPLPLWNREQGTEAALRAGVVGAAVETERIRQDVERQVRLAHARLTVAMRAWTDYGRTALPAANEALARLEEGYRQGYLALPDVLVQEDRLVRARDTEIATWLETRDAEADLVEAVGDEAVLR
jgi:cobalt-zinc-cadmium efflux system outer membrane protein